jgi:raffinose/stachyose/melibiose transport system substrate-binding protein
MLKKRSFLTVLLCIIVVAISILSACSRSDSDTSAEQNQEKESKEQNDEQNKANNNDGVTKKEKVKITFTHGRSKLEENNQVYETIVKNYNALNGKAEVELVLVDFGETGNDHRTWVTTQLIGGTAPDVFQSRYIWTHEDYGKELIAELNNFLKQPNPYNNNAEWNKTFADSIIANMVVPTTDKIAGIPTYSLSVRLFYNKEIFNEVGISKVPETWAEFLEAQAKIQEKGFVPMAVGTSKQGGDRPNWMFRYFSDQTVETLVPEMDLDKNGRITSNEIVAAIDNETIDFAKKPWIDIFPIMKDWTRFWPKGFNGLTVDDATEMFLRGDAAMTLNLPSFAKELEGFMDYGVMRVPYFTKETHPMAEERYYEVAAGNPDGVYAIPKTTSPEKQEAAADFLMYLTSPEVQQMLAQQLYRVPILKDAKFPDNIKQFLVVNEPFKMNLFGPAFSKGLYETLGKDGQLYLDGSLELDKFVSKLNEAARKEAASLKESQGWSKDNGYGTKK